MRRPFPHRVFLVVLAVVVISAVGWLSLSPSPHVPVTGAAHPGPAAAPEAESADAQPPASLEAPTSVGAEAAPGRAILDVTTLEDPSADAASLALYLPEHYVHVRVLTDAGAPAVGVPVSLRTKYALRDPLTMMSTWTDADGEAYLHSNKFTKLVTGKEKHFGQPSLSVFAELPMTSEVALDVPWPAKDAPAAEVVHELRLPPLGSVTVHVVDPDGEPFLESIWVGARWVPTVEVGTEVYGGYNRCMHEHDQTTTGVTRYDFVGADVSMSFTAQAAAYGNGGAVDVPITVEPGGNQDVTVQLGARRPLVRCRVLAVDGQPVASEELKGKVWHGPESGLKRPFSYPFSLQTDAQGLAEFFFKIDPDADHPRRLHLERLAGGSPSKPSADWSRLDVALPLRLSTAPEHDLGTARLVAPELLQAGTVYDFRGEPASSVRMSFYAEQPGEPIQRNKPNDIGVAYSGRDGRFEFRAFGERPPGMRVSLYGSVKVDGSRKKVYGEYLDLAVGDRSATFTLKAPPEAKQELRGTVPVSVLFDDGLPGAYFAIQLLRDGGRKEAVPMSLLKESPLPLKLEPGTWSVRVFLYGLDHELLLIDGLEVTANATLNDARCQPIDMRGLAQRARFPVQRPNGAPWRGKKLWVRAKTPPLDGHLRTGEDGYLDVALPANCSGLELSPEGEFWTPVDPKSAEAVTLVES